jgi:agmatinase
MYSKQDKIDHFDPNGVGLIGNQIFGLPFTQEESDIVLLPVPRDVTVSYGAGTAQWPKAVFQESFQVDLYIPWQEDAWKRGIYMLDIDPTLEKASKRYRAIAKKIIDEQANWATIETLAPLLNEVNQGCEAMVSTVKHQAQVLLQNQKIVGLIWWDHSTPLWLIQACAELYDNFWILQIDAHSDLRDAYEWFTYSHASIMTNALQLSSVQKLVQVGIRDFCKEEMEVIQTSNQRIETFFDKQIKQASYQWIPRAQQVIKMIDQLPHHVYISFDIDALDPKLCPHTGTPVAWGFEAEQVVYLIEQVVQSGRKIIAFDINEVGNDPWDANVAARLLYHIANLVRTSQQQ